MESIVNQEPTAKHADRAQKGRAGAMAWAVRVGLRLLKRFHRNQRGVTGLETAILLTAFVTGSSAMGAAYLSSSLEINEEVQSVAMDTIDSIVMEGQVYIERQRLQVPYGTSFAGQQAFDLGSLGDALATALDDEQPYTIETQTDGAVVLTIDLGTEGMTGVAEVVSTLAESLGSESPYTIEVIPGQGMLLRMELQPPLLVGGPDNTG